MTVTLSVGDVADCEPAATVPAAPALESVTFTVKFALPVAVGVPVIVPVLALRFSPVGREVPLATLKASAPAPPVSAIVWLYATPTTPAGSDWAGIEGNGVTTMLSEADLVASATDVAATVAVIFAPDVGAV